MNTPLAERIRPKTLADYIGQKHIVGENGSLGLPADWGHAINIAYSIILRLEIDFDMLTYNASTLVTRLREKGVSVTEVVQLFAKRV